jgi:hypothetical protein
MDLLARMKAVHDTRTRPLSRRIVAIGRASISHLMSFTLRVIFLFVYLSIYLSIYLLYFTYDLTSVEGGGGEDGSETKGVKSHRFTLINRGTLRSPGMAVNHVVCCLSWRARKS